MPQLLVQDAASTYSWSASLKTCLTKDACLWVELIQHNINILLQVGTGGHGAVG